MGGVLVSRKGWRQAGSIGGTGAGAAYGKKLQRAQAATLCHRGATLHGQTVLEWAANAG